jgi:hypothetical protein
MRHLRPYLALLTIAAMTAACSAGGSSGGESQGNQPSTGSQPSQAAASSGGGGGGGGGGGANGSATYEITGDATKSGELAFTYINGGISQFIDTGWVAYFYSADQQTIIQVNSQQGTNIVNFADGEILVVGTDADGSCTFDYSQNDSSGLKGSIDCSDPIASKVATTGERIHVKLHVTVDAHT